MALRTDHAGSTNLQHLTIQGNLGVCPGDDHHYGVQSLAFPDDFLYIRPDNTGQAGRLQDYLGAFTVRDVQHRIGSINLCGINSMGRPHRQRHFPPGF
ncbi:hypothetical protein ES708_34597 [subsurface metagenome]